MTLHVTTVNATTGDRVEVWCSCGTILANDLPSVTVAELTALVQKHRAELGAPNGGQGRAPPAGAGR